MKRLYQFLAVCICMAVLLSMTVLSVDAATVSVNKTPKVGETFTVTVKADNTPNEVYSVNAVLNYNSAVCQFVSINHGTTYDTGNAVKFNEGLNGDNSFSYTLTFKMLKSGTANFSLASGTYSDGESDYSFSGSASVTVKDSSASSKSTSSKSASSKSASSKDTSSKTASETNQSANADLSSLKISDTVLSPVFSAGTLSYSAKVGADIDKITVSASAVDSKAKVTGTGTFALAVGTQKISVTVTAPSGAKKTYTVMVTRPEADETDANAVTDPLAVRVDGQPYHVAADLSKIEAIAGLTVHDATLNGTDIQVLSDETGTFTVYYLVSDADSKGGYYRYLDQRDEYQPIQYLKLNNVMYLFADDGLLEAPVGYTVSEVNLGNGMPKVYCSTDETYKDFGILYCFANGKYQYYQYDFAENTIQRVPAFPKDEPSQTTVAAPEKSENKTNNAWNWFSRLSSSGKTTLIVLAVAALCLVALLFILPIAAFSKLRKKKKKDGKKDSFDDISSSSGNSF